MIPVAIFSSEDFNATQVDPDTVLLAGAGAEVQIQGKGNEFMSQKEDIDGDGTIDLILHIGTANLDPDAIQDGYVVLTGTTYDGQAIEGWDEVTIVPPEE